MFRRRRLHRRHRLPQLLRDAQVYAIWEGTTNVLSLDSLRALAGDTSSALRTASTYWLDGNDDMHAASAIRQALDAAARWIDQHAHARDTLEAGARGLAFTLARCAAAALLARQASWSSAHGDPRSAAALQRFVRPGWIAW
jgi:acyl-CoA dehydrogenase